MYYMKTRLFQLAFIVCLLLLPLSFGKLSADQLGAKTSTEIARGGHGGGGHGGGGHFGGGGGHWGGGGGHWGGGGRRGGHGFNRGWDGGWRYGYRHTYLASVVLLMVGRHRRRPEQLVRPRARRMRVAEGLAAGVLQPIPAIVVMHAFAAGERGKAMGLFGFGVVLAPALGPSIGGVLVEWFGWRSIFFVVTPFCLLAIAMGQRYLPIGAPGGAPISRSGGRLDFVGLGLIAVAVLALLNGMVHLHAPTLDLGLALVGGSIVATVGFVLHQRRGARPLMALGLFEPPRVHDGRPGRLHLRHGALRLDLPGAGLHAGGAPSAAVAGGRRAAAGGARPRG